MATAEGEQEELNVLFHAVQLGRTDIVKNAVASLRETKSPEELLEILSGLRPEEGLTLLHVGAAAGHSDVIRALLNSGVDASIAAIKGDFVGKTAYQVAEPTALQAFHVYLFEKIALGQEAVIANLLDAGIAVDLRDSSSIDDSTLHWACSFGNARVASLLLERGCPVNILNGSRQTPLHLACKNGSREVIELLLSKEANANISDDQGRFAADMVPPKHSELVDIVKSHIAENRDQHHVPPLQNLSADGSTTGTELNSHIIGESPIDHGSLRSVLPSPLYTQQRSISNVSSHLILWPPPQRQRMLPMSAFEEHPTDDNGSVPEFGIVFSSIRPVLISCSTEQRCSVDVGCIAEVCGLTQAFRRFGLDCVVLRSPATSDIRFSVNPSLCPGHHRYSINVCPSFISVIGSDKEGLLYGAYTLVQITQLHSEFGVMENEAISLDQSGEDIEFDMNGFNVGPRKTPDVIRTLTIPCVSVEDWPDFPSRGITWSLNSTALTNISSLHNIIAMISRLRLNKLFLSVDCLDYSSSLGHADAAASARQRENILSGSRIYYIERLCKFYFVDVVPIVKVPCCDYESSGCYEKRLNVDALRCFSSSVVHVDFFLETNSSVVDDAPGSVNALVARNCRLALKSLRGAGFLSVVVTCSSSFQQLYDPISIATHVGLLGIYGEIDSCVDDEPQHALSSHLFVKEAELRCRNDMEQGKTLSLAPGFVGSSILCPLVLLKYKFFLHSGFSWNRETVLDIIGFSTDIQMLEEVINLTLFTEGNGSLLTTSAADGYDGSNKFVQDPKNDEMLKSSSTGLLSSLDGQETEKGAPNGFYFWRKQVSSDSMAGGSASPHNNAPSISRSEFIMSLLTCSDIFSPHESNEERKHERRPIFEATEGMRNAVQSPFYKKSPAVRPSRAHSGQSETRSRKQAADKVDSYSFSEAESMFWNFLGAKTLKEFVTCGNTRGCDNNSSEFESDGYAPSKAQALEVLKRYRRALSSVGWKLDRKKMASLRENGMSSDTYAARAQWGAEAITNRQARGKNGEVEFFIFENGCPEEQDLPFPSYQDARSWDNSCAAESKSAKNGPCRSVCFFPSSPEMSNASLQLEIEEIYVVLHLICTVCRAVILGYNACEKVRGTLPDGELLKFSELLSILPTGSTSDIANALLEGIEYGLMIWNRRFERLSFSVRRGINSSKVGIGVSEGVAMAEPGPSIPGIGAFYWISQNLPQQVEDLFFNTLTILQRK